MKLTIAESMALARAVREFVERHDTPDLHIALCPSHAALSEVGKILATSGIALGAQDAAHVDRASLTGATSPLHLAELGVKEVIIGHSERRAIFGETDELVHHKAKAVLAHGLTAIICVGERKEERDRGEAETVVRRQARAAVDAGTPWEKLCIAYEPVWAIGTGTPVRREDAVAQADAIRDELGKALGNKDAGARIPVLYGGSVDGDNVRLFTQAPLNGTLVGTASQSKEGMYALLLALRTLPQE
ncbi:triose-phosphate isomerase [Candidatus Uhrbacteria bacterium RIFCSPLOWO2_02_FULL_49_11]|uniref:Triosephosphate isomerase n=1 Tax=Candidatus Uhrbacteria bacterium RIFCSPLOWO2_02_FULL_49_11 TaxID=1802409 RepID=A0A1F7VDD3_9BACT|nr:MAG: triose-phosphate isomerase [Candidatus Uhrbacteria bacterium RIFCSPLOWO2_02_FULL_49_11]